MTLKELKETARVFDLKTLQDKAFMASRLTIHQKRIDEGPGIDKEQHRNELNDYTIPQLKAMLTHYHMKTTGSKKDLVRMLIELPMAKIDLPGKIPKSDTKKQETMKAMENVEKVTQLKKSIQDRIARVKALRDTVVKPTSTSILKPTPPVVDRFDNTRMDIIRLLEKVSVDPAKYQSELSTIRKVVNDLEKLATTSSDRKSIKRFRLILKKLLIVVPIEEAIPSTEPTSKGIVIKRPPVNKDVPKDIAPVISKLQTDLEELRSIGKKSKYQTTKFLPNNEISNMVFLALLSKYNNPAIIIDVKQKDPRYPELYAKRIGINVILSPTDTDSDFKVDVDYLGQQLQYFKNVGVDVICIPVAFYIWGGKGGKSFVKAHANMTIYHPKSGMVEHCEPYGKSFDGDRSNITLKVNNSLSKLWKVQLTKWIGPITYVPSSFVCRTYNGLQTLSGGEVCALWSCFIAEFALMNPMDTVMDMMEEILGIINEDAEYAKDVIYGYIDKAEELVNEEWAVKYIAYTADKTDIPLVSYNTRLDIIKQKKPVTYNIQEYNKAIQKFEGLYTFLEESIARTKKTSSSIRELRDQYERTLKLVVTDEQRERLQNLKKLIPNTKDNHKEVPKEVAPVIRKYQLSNPTFEGSYRLLEKSIATTPKTSSSIRKQLDTYAEILKLAVTDEQRERLQNLKKKIGPVTSKLILAR